MPARIIAVAEAYDTITNDKPYRKGLNKKEAINEIRKDSGTRFDPDIARVFIEMVLEDEVS